MYMHDVTAIILGGGRGTRLFPLTHERAKPSVSVAGKYRLIDIPLSNCINSGIRRIFVLTQFLSASLHRHIMQTYKFDMFTDGFIDILAAEQTLKGDRWFQGTADAVRATLDHTTYYDSECTLILSGDHLYRMDYSDLIKFHRTTGSDITICVYPVDRLSAPSMGLIKTECDGRVVDFVEKPKDDEIINRFKAPQDIAGVLLPQKIADEEMFLASMGIYLFNTDTLISMITSGKETDFGKELIPRAIRLHKVNAYPFTGYWKDIGTIKSFFEANLELLLDNPPFELYKPGWPFYTHARSLPPSRIFESQIYRSLIAEGSWVSGSQLDMCVLGPRSRVAYGSKLNRVIMFGSDFYENEEILRKWSHGNEPRIPMGIGNNCYIENVILDKNVRIGDNVTIKAPLEKPAKGSEYAHWVDGIYVLAKGTVVPSSTIIV